MAERHSEKRENEFAQGAGGVEPCCRKGTARSERISSRSRCPGQAQAAARGECEEPLAPGAARTAAWGAR